MRVSRNIPYGFPMVSGSHIMWFPWKFSNFLLESATAGCVARGGGVWVVWVWVAQTENRGHIELAITSSSRVD